MYNDDVKISNWEIQTSTTEELLEMLAEEETQLDCRVHRENYDRICRELKNRNKRY